MPDTALLSGLDCLSKNSILSEIEKAERVGIENVWEFICLRILALALKV